MDAPSLAVSSNVTVEYTDPSGLFPLFQPVIERRLPLKNLHWKSPSRPVRSIESLRISFVPEQNHVIEGKPSSDRPRSTVQHRRHQIPGLRQTPYLKIYLLRCDDNETYKATVRKSLREWIKAHGSTPLSGTASSSQEKHDAFEWIIIHILQDGDAPEKTASTSKWGRSTTTVLEKAKADFNGSSKSSVDRVAQLRLPKPGTTQQPAELAEQLDDVVEKMQTAILASFDQRVAQYEEDIKERDSQRNLPGWNFCTFFILKEGLARGFEDVGLYEDALVGYDELSVGLDTTIRDQLQGDGDQHGGALLASSQDWKDRALKALESAAEEKDKVDSDSDKTVTEVEEPLDVMSHMDDRHFPLDSSKKPYRDMILANNISIFDFRVYVFSRQLTLLLRAARAPWLVKKETGINSKEDAGNKKIGDLIHLAKICERAGEFLSTAARALRYDLECGLASVVHDSKATVIDNLVSCWAFAAASQILSQTFTTRLVLAESPFGISGKEAAAGIESHPDGHRLSLAASRSTAQQALSPHVAPKAGFEELASERADLLAFSRRVLESVAARLGWSHKWDDLGLLFSQIYERDTELKDVSLDDSAAEERIGGSNMTRSISGIELPVLRTSLRSRTAFRSLYEALTKLMLRHYLTANRQYSAKSAMTDIAVLRFYKEDYGSAASHFHQIAPFYVNQNWSILEGVALEMYARCLKELKRPEEFIQILLRLLSQFAAHSESNRASEKKTLIASSDFGENLPLSAYVDELFETSNTCQKEFSAAVNDFFSDVHVKPAIALYDDRDGFQIQLSLRFLLGKRIEIDSIKLRLVSANGLVDNEHWIESSSKVTVKSLKTKILIASTMTLLGKYFIDRLELRAGNIVFSFPFKNKPGIPLNFAQDMEPDEEESRPYIYCFPRPNGFQARVLTPDSVDLGKSRTLELELESGQNVIKTSSIRVRPATAGLRLRAAEAEIIEGAMKFHVNSDAGTIEIAELGAECRVRFRIPYSVDANHPKLSTRVEVSYETSQGKFSYASVFSIVPALPISVNVQDIFKDDVLFSKFSISPATQIPLRILSCNISSTEYYDVQASNTGPVTFDVFPKLPASLLFKIKQRSDDRKRQAGTRRLLRLSVEFTCLDDECLDIVGKTIKRDLERSKFGKYASLLSRHLAVAFRTLTASASDMEAIGLIREIGMLRYEAVQWDGLLCALEESTDEIRDWLKEWHKNNPVLALPESPAVCRRSLVIPVDISEVQVVHTAEMRLKGLAEESAHAAVGQMVPAELHIRHTRRWCAAENREKSLEFSYEIHANPELWLIGGRRRGNFTAQEGETLVFEIMLLPQKAGHLLLPGLEIKTFVPLPAPAASTSMQRKQIPCEVDYRNHAESLLVLPDLCKTTVSLSTANCNSGGGSWLVDSERRNVVGRVSHVEV